MRHFETYFDSRSAVPGKPGGYEIAIYAAYIKGEYAFDNRTFNNNTILDTRRIRYALDILGIKYEDVIIGELGGVAAIITAKDTLLIKQIIIEAKNHIAALWYDIPYQPYYIVKPRTVHYLLKQNPGQSFESALESRGIYLEEQRIDLFAIKKHIESFKTEEGKQELSSVNERPDLEGFKEKYQQFLEAQSKLNKTGLLDNIFLGTSTSFTQGRIASPDFSNIYCVRNYVRALILRGVTWTENGIIEPNCIQLENGGYKVSLQDQTSIENLRKLDQEALTALVKEKSQKISSVDDIKTTYQGMTFEEQNEFSNQELLSVLQKGNVIISLEGKSDEKLISFGFSLNNLPIEAWSDQFFSIYQAFLETLTTDQYTLILQQIDIEKRMAFLTNKITDQCWVTSINTLSDFVEIAKVLPPKEFSILLDHLRQHTKEIKFLFPAEFEPNKHESWNSNDSSGVNLIRLFKPLYGFGSFFGHAATNGDPGREIKKYLDSRPKTKLEIMNYLLDMFYKFHGNIKPNGENAKRLLYALTQLSKDDELNKEFSTSASTTNGSEKQQRNIPVI